MTRRLAWLTASLALLGSSVAVLFLACTDGRPLVVRGPAIVPQTMAEAKQLFRANDPRRLREGERRRVAIPATLIDEGANHLANHFLDGRGAFSMGEESAEIRLTVPIPYLPVPRYINLRASFREAEGEPRIATASLGKLPLPPQLLEWALESALQASSHAAEWRLTRDAIRRLAFEPTTGMVVIDYVWNTEILDRARSMLFSPADIQRLREAQTALAGMLDHRAPRSAVPLIAVLKPLLELPDDDRRARRRTSLLLLAVYLAEKDIAELIPEARRWAKPRPVALTLRGRHDTAQHFVISATLAAWAGEPVAEAVGAYKELHDARHGSGFSFADLAADRAGTRFGELVAGNDIRVDKLMQGKPTDGDLVPPLYGLPEYLPERIFLSRYGGPGQPSYDELLSEIERRLNKLPIYR